MRVAVFAPMNFSRTLGDVIRVLEIASNLEKNGCEVTLLVPQGSRNKINVTVSNIIEFPTIGAKNQYLNYMFSLFSYSFFANKVLKTGDFDVIQAELGYTIPRTPLNRLSKKLPLICDMHSIVAFDLADVFSYPLSLPICSLTWSWQKSLIKDSGGILVVSRKMKEYLLRALDVPSKKIAVIYNGVNINLADVASRETKEKYVWVKESGQFVIAYIGSLEQYEGVDILIKAFSKFQQQNGSASLVIAGSGTKKESLEYLAKDLGVEKKIHFLGNIPYRETFGLQVNADVLVAPRKPMKVYDISFPIKVVNYLSAGKPVIASAVGDIPLSFRNLTDMYMVRSEDVDALANALSTVSNDARLRRTLSQNAKHKANEFDWSVLTKKLINFYKEAA